MHALVSRMVILPEERSAYLNGSSGTPIYARFLAVSPEQAQPAFPVAANGRNRFESAMINHGFRTLKGSGSFVVQGPP